MVKNIVTPWSFRDGKEYIVSLGVGDNPKNVSISISNKITAEEWSCNHDCKYIENLTQKTGSYKAFDTFISMIKSAILKKSDAVTLDLMTSEDLEAIKHQKLQSEVVLRAQVGSPTSNFTNFQAQPKLFGSQKNRNLQEEDKRRYLIVSYIAEFDRVHYPVPLNYSGPPDPFIMQSNILKLQSEVTHLRTAKSNLEKKLSHGGHTKKPQNPFIDFNSLVTLKEVESMYETDDTVSLVGSNRLKNHNANANSRKKSLEAENDDRMKKGDGVQNAESETRETHQFQQTLERVFAVVHNLEQKIFEERAKMKELQAQNDSLRSKLSDYKDSDKELRLRIKYLESLQTSKLRRVSSEDHYRNINPTGTYTILNDKEYRRNSRGDMMKLVDDVYSSHLNIRSSSTERKAKGPLERDPPRCQRSRCNSVDSNVSCTSKSSNKSVRRNPGSRSVSPAGRSPVFDPTAYVNEKKRRQEQMAELRLSRIQARINSRSASREKIKLQDSPRSLQLTNYSPSFCSVCDEEPFNASSNDRVGCLRSHHRKVNNQTRHQAQSAKFPFETNKSVNNRRNSPSPARNEKVRNNFRNRCGRSPERKAPISNVTWRKSMKTDPKETTHKSANNHPKITNKTNNSNLLTRNSSATNCKQNQQRSKNSTRVTSGWAEWAMPTVKMSRSGI